MSSHTSQTITFRTLGFKSEFGKGLEFSAFRDSPDPRFRGY
jgi:hypothetical protein